MCLQLGGEQSEANSKGEGEGQTPALGFLGAFESRPHVTSSRSAQSNRSVKLIWRCGNCKAAEPFSIQRRICVWPWYPFRIVACRFTEKSGDLAQLRLSLLQAVLTLLILLITVLSPISRLLLSLGTHAVV